VVHELVEGAIPGQAADRHDRVGEAAGKEAARLGRVAGTVAGHVEEGGGRCPAHGGNEEIGLDDRAVAELDGGQPPVPAGPHHVPAPAGVDDPGDLHAGVLQVGNGVVPLGVGGEHHGPLARPHRPQVDQAAGGGGEHHPGQVVARKDVGPLDQPGRHDQRAGPDLDEALGDAGLAPLHHGDPVVVVPSRHHRVEEHLHAVLGGQGLPELPAGGEVGPVTKAEMAAQLGLLLHQHDPSPSPRRCGRRRHAGWAAPGHQHVDVGVALVEVRLLRCHRRDATAGGESSEHRLVGGPQRSRLDEGLVVEAGPEEPAERLVGRLGIQAQRRPGVLGCHPHPRLHPAVGAPHVGLVSHLDQAVGVVEGGGEHATGPVVLEAAGEHPHPRGGEGGDDGVTGVGREGPPVPREREVSGPVEHLPGAGIEPAGGGDGPAPSQHPPHGTASLPYDRTARISLVTVWRSTRRKRRQPATWNHVSVVHPAGLRRS
jgi:hypothetical protein